MTTTSTPAGIDLDAALDDVLAHEYDQPDGQPATTIADPFTAPTGA